MGEILGSHFELLAEAARGGMGSVYRGKDLRTGRMVAIKVLNLSNPSDHIRFERECNVLARLRHDNVVGYVAHGASPEGTRFLVQEWVDGITLSTQIQMLGLTAVDAMKVAIGVSDALGAAHAHGAVHRDVKPANIILDAGDPERVKLVDFGIARMAADAGVLTRAGILVGTPSYMAPEQARGLVEITPAADVWALGCVLYEAISGRKAFGGRSPEAILAKALLHEPTQLDVLAPEIPVELAFYIHNMLAKRAEDRPENGNEVARTLREFLPSVPVGPIRKVYQLETQPTRLDPSPPRKPVAARCFVMVSVPPPEPDAPPRTPIDIEKISGRHHLKMHPLDDGSMILEALDPGDGGAASIAYAAMEIQGAEGFDGALSAFAQATEEPLDHAIDRGADSLADVTMASMFAEAVGAEPFIPVDEVMAAMLEREGVTLITTDNGRALRAARHQTG